MKQWVSLRLLIIALASLFILAACGGETASTPTTSANTPEPAGAPVELTLGVLGNELKFDKTELKVKAGQQVKITFTNNSPALPHSFSIDKTSVKIPDNTLTGLSAGASGTATFTAPAAGTYEFVCSFPGHKESGMVGKLIVE
jgi:plastocyanin